MKLLWLGIAGALIGCTVTQPVAVVSNQGIMRGSTTASLSQGHFQVADKHRTCGGAYDPLDTSSTISLKVMCSDGARGIAVISRSVNGESGHGTVRMDDGTEASLIFGPGAEAF